MTHGNAAAQDKGGFFGKIKDSFSTEIKIGNYKATDKDGRKVLRSMIAQASQLTKAARAGHLLLYRFKPESFPVNF
ncbi:hypothetical protein AXF24_13045 [Streptococcus pneumoniae]|nr:hypothetical protein AWW74_13055 [Streptococcus pneumoniae]KXB94314.1 hypothetical protein AXF24_13045 [Streptococcus pneumoniae]